VASQEFNRVLQSTIAEYMLGAEDLTIRNRKFLALLKAKGRITFNHSGTELNWGIRYKMRQLAGYADGDTIAFARSDTFKRANLPWRGYTLNDLVTKKEKLMNRGKPALIKYVSELVENMMEDFTQQFHRQLYIDGNASGNSKFIHGFDSFCSTFNNNPNNFIATPNNTYASLSTNPGTYGGSWTGTWPSGFGDPEYDFWSPILVDYTNQGWPETTKSWPNTCHDALRYGIIKCKRNDSIKGMIDVVMLDQELYRQWLPVLDNKERVIVNPGTGSDAGTGKGARPTLRNLGFGDVQNFEGAEVTWEFNVPVDANNIAQGYGFNMDEMELCSLQDKLFVSEGPYYDEATLSDRFAIHMFGNMKFNPRYFVKWLKSSP
jgi:hypothetical protein